MGKIVSALRLILVPDAHCSKGNTEEEVARKPRTRKQHGIREVQPGAQG